MGALVHSLDRVRAASLGLILRGRPGLIRLYRDRPRRLAALYSINLLLSLGLALFAPLWTLFLGPLVLGFPHLLQSLRHSSEHAPEPRLFVKGVSALFAAIAGLRLWQDFSPHSLPLIEPWRSFWESASVVLVVLWTLVCARREGLKSAPLRVIAGTLFLLLAWKLPGEVAGTLVLLHNLVAFLFWIRLTPPASRERHVAWLATGLFTLTTILILAGAFRSLYLVYRPSIELAFAGLDLRTLAQTIWPESNDSRWWTRLVVAYAFGQSQHYFVWMKAIPDSRHSSPTPPSFREGLRNLNELLPGRAGLTALSLVVAAVGMSVFLEWPQARAFYFAIASAHGYLELATLLGAPRRG